MLLASLFFGERLGVRATCCGIFKTHLAKASYCQLTPPAKAGGKLSQLGAMFCPRL